MKKIVFVLIIVALFFVNSDNANATEQWAGSLDVQQAVYVRDNWCYVQIAVDMPTTCSYYGYRFKFNVTTAQGKAMLSIILLAKTLNKKISVWYNPSAAPGTDSTNGCTDATVSEAVGIAIQ